MILCRGSKFVFGPVEKPYSLSNKAALPSLSGEDRRREEGKLRGLRLWGGPADRNHITKKGERGQHPPGLL